MMNAMPGETLPASLSNLRNELNEVRRKRNLRPNYSAETMDKVAYELENLQREGQAAADSRN